MKKIIYLGFLMLAFNAFSQQKVKEFQAGHIIKITVPEYMTKTIGLNDDACIQFQNLVKDVYTIVIEDNKEELTMAELSYADVKEFYEDFAEGFLKDEKDRKMGKPKYSKIKDINYVVSEASYFDTESNIPIYYVIGVVETKTAYYKVLSWTTEDKKAQYKADFEKIIFTLKD